MTKDILDGTRWQVGRLNGEDVDPSAPNSIEFADGRVSGQVGVNRFTGSYEIEDGKVVFGPAASTMMAGPPHLMELEQAFLAALQGDQPIAISTLSLGGIELRAASGADSITGSALYRERIMMPAGSVVTVQLEDVSRADASAEVLASCVIEDAAGPPFEFTLTPERPLDPQHSYAVRATITGPDGSLMWTTDTHYDPTATPLELILVRV